MSITSSLRRNTLSPAMLAQPQASERTAIRLDGG